MKKVLIVFLIIGITLFSLAIVKDLLIKSAVTALAARIIGAKVQIDSLSLSLLKQAVRVSGLKIYNPQGFPDAVMINLPLVAVDLDLPSLLKGKLHLERVDMELKEVSLVRNQEGRLNADSLKVSQAPAKAQKEKEKETKEPARELAMQIDLVNLSLGRVVLKDYGAGPQPTVLVYEMNLKKSYKNITSAQQLITLILAESLKQAGIKSATLYGASMLTGVAVLPVAVASAFMGKDSVEESFNAALPKVYDASLRLLKRIGKVTMEDKAGGVIAAEVSGASVSVKLKESSDRSTQVVVSAKKFLFPNPEIANGILYQIGEELKI